MNSGIGEIDDVCKICAIRLGLSDSRPFHLIQVPIEFD